MLYPFAASRTPRAVRAASTAITSALTGLAWLVALAPGAANAQAPEPVYWRQRVFLIPYQPGSTTALAKDHKVQLLVSRGGLNDWTLLQEAEPNVRGFGYHAPADGEYAFALRISDGHGRFTPATIAAAQLRVVVDTTPPALQLAAALDATGRVVVRYEAADGQLKPETIRLEVQADGKTWERAALGPPDVSHPDRVLGQLAWKPPLEAGDLRFRATIDDQAGNQGAAETKTSLVGPLLGPADGPQLAPPGGDWMRQASSGAPPYQNPYTVAPTNSAETVRDPWTAAPRTSAQLVADGGSNLPTDPFSGGDGESLSPPPLMTTPRAQQTVQRPPPSSQTMVDPGWASRPATTTQPSTTTRWVNSLMFDVDYDVQTVGPWGVAKIELWATRDGGATWIAYGADADNRAPMRVTVPSAGVYGFRLVVDSANGAAAPTPAPGDKPELVIGVDLDAPRVELLAAEVGEGHLADHLLIGWSADDEGLVAKPIGLFFSSQPDGPWSTIATDLDNSGQYAWRLLRQVPEQLYLRVEARDVANNLTVRQTPTPVELKLPKPTGRLRDARPVEADPSRYRTASGRDLAPGQ